MHTFGPRTGKARSRLLIPVLIATHAIYQRRVGYWPPRAPRKTAPCCPAACWWEPVPCCRECLLPRLLVICVSSLGDDQCFAGFGLRAFSTYSALSSSVSPASSARSGLAARVLRTATSRLHAPSCS